MNALFASALRLAVILLGYVAACLAASAFMHLLFLGSQDFSAEQMQWIVTGSLIFTVPFVALFVAYFALLPAAAVIVAGELLRRRD